MGKKGLFVLVLTVVVTAWAFAMPDLPEFRFSLGGGGYLTGDFGGGARGSGPGVSGTIRNPYFGGGAFIFVDATFVELSLGIFGGGGTSSEEWTGVPRYSWSRSFSGLDIGLLGKYPVVMSSQLTVFPIAGINFRSIFSVRDAGYGRRSNSSDFSALWFKLGGGLDYFLTDHIFLRGQVLYGFRVRNRAERDEVNYWNRYPGVSARARLGHGPTIRFAVGYRF